MDNPETLATPGTQVTKQTKEEKKPQRSTES
jgi:hypothetical protein